MNNRIPTAAASLAAQFAAQIDATMPDKKPPIIMAIIEVKSDITEQRRRGYSWNALTGLLAAMGVHTTAGTLRNYIAMIGNAELALRAAGNATPTDREIYEAIRNPPSPAKQSQLPKAVPTSLSSRTAGPPQTPGPSDAQVQPAPAKGAAHTPITVARQLHSSINHNPNRQL